LSVYAPNWFYVAFGGGAMALTGVLVLVLIDPLLRYEFLSWARHVNPLHVEPR